MTEPWVLPSANVVAFLVGFAIGYRHPFLDARPSPTPRPRADPTTVLGHPRRPALGSRPCRRAGEHVACSRREARRSRRCGRSWSGTGHSPPRTFPDRHGTGRARHRHRPPGVGVMLLTDLDHGERPREPRLVRVRRVVTGDEHAPRGIHPVLDVVGCWQRMARSPG
jgi:hypothetical protein